jgi:hypothetical protein
MALNQGRIWLGGFVGGIVWNAWGFFLHAGVVKESRFDAMKQAGLFLKEPRLPAFPLQWAVILFALAIIVAYLYAWTRTTLGPGPGTALKLGLLLGFGFGFACNLAQIVWSPLPLVFPMGWLLEMWVGAILAALIAGWLYKSAGENA